MLYLEQTGSDHKIYRHHTEPNLYSIATRNNANVSNLKFHGAANTSRAANTLKDGVGVPK